MTRVILIALISSCLIGTAMAQSCESKAVSAEGKPLHSAAKASFVRKCKQDACEGKAIHGEMQEISLGKVNVRFGSKADINRTIGNAALPPKADISQHNGNLRFTQSRHQPTWPLLTPA